VGGHTGWRRALHLLTRGQTPAFVVNEAILADFTGIKMMPKSNFRQMVPEKVRKTRKMGKRREPSGGQCHEQIAMQIAWPNLELSVRLIKIDRLIVGKT
jgi:hypothetical protein